MTKNYSSSTSVALSDLLKFDDVTLRSTLDEIAQGNVRITVDDGIETDMRPDESQKLKEILSKLSVIRQEAIVSEARSTNRTIASATVAMMLTAGSTLLIDIATFMRLSFFVVHGSVIYSTIGLLMCITAATFLLRKLQFERVRKTLDAIIDKTIIMINGR